MQSIALIIVMGGIVYAILDLIHHNRRNNNA